MIVSTRNLTFKAPTPQNGHIHSNNSQAFADDLFLHSKSTDWVLHEGNNGT